MGDWTAERAEKDGVLATAVSTLIALAANDRVDARSRQILLDTASNLRAGAIAPTALRLLDAIPDAVTIHDERGDVIDANLAACRLYGHAHGKLLTLNLIDLSPDLPPEHIEHVIETCRISDGFTIETSIRRSDGRAFPVEVHANAYETQGASEVVWIARGISHWQRTATALRDSENRFQLLLRTLQQSIHVCNVTGHVVYINPAGLKMLSMRDQEELLQASRDGYPGWQWFDESGRRIERNEFPSVVALATGKPTQPRLLRVVQPNRREPLWVSITAAPLLRAGDDKPYQAVISCSDVTELKRARDVLAKTQSMGGVGGFEVILDNEHLFCTDGMYHLLDVSPDVPLTLNRLLSLLDGHADGAVRHNLRTVAQAGQPLHLEHEIATESGRRRWLNIALEPQSHDDKVWAVAGMCQDITARKHLELELRHKAITDPLTGLPNREAILEELHRRIIATRPGETGPSLLYVDLDRFKVINDILGAAAGDDLIAAAAERLDAALPDGARCGRFASDEFLVVMPRQLRAESAAELAEKIVQSFRRPFQHQGEDYIVTATVGLARYPQDGQSVKKLLRHADAAMSDAKRRGRNVWQAFSSDIERQLEHDLAIGTQLSHALERQELRLAWQPQVDMRTGRLVGAEALLRWQHPQRGELLPMSFVPQAEISGDIIPIGAWVVQEACRKLRGWRDEDIAIPRIAINVAYRQLLSEGFLDLVAMTLRQYELEGDALEIEMIERMLIEDTPETLQVLKDLRELGVRVLIDDFGEGYSSLAYLRRLPIDALKISGEFVRRAPTTGPDLAICEAIVRVGHGLGLDLIAEGVETEEQKQLLLQQGVHVAQGNLFAGAIDADALLAFARDQGCG